MEAVALLSYFKIIARLCFIFINTNLVKRKCFADVLTFLLIEKKIRKTVSRDPRECVLFYKIVN